MPVRSSLLILTLLAVAGVTGCGSSSSDPDVTDPPPPVAREVKAGPDQLKLRPFPGCDAYRDFISETIVNDLIAPDVYAWGFVSDIGLTAPPAPVPADPAGGSPDIVSTTNVVEAGVDEADLVKADVDGNLFVASGRYLVVADGFPPDNLQAIAELELVEEGYARSLFIDSDSGKALVIVDFTPDPLGPGPGPLPGPAPFVLVPPQGVTLVFVDISDPASPRISGRLWLERSSQERLIDGRVHLLNQRYFYYPYDIYTDQVLFGLLVRYAQALGDDDQAAIDQLRAEIKARVSEIVAVVPIEEFLPRARIAAADGEFSELTLAACADIVRPELSIRLGLATVLSMNLDGSDIGALTALATVRDAYVSATNFYLQQSSVNWWLDPDQAEQTAIHKVSIGAGPPEYRGMGLVDGIAEDPFQFSEAAGYLRVFTHERRLMTGGLWQPDLTNHLFVLEDDGAGTLAPISSVKNIARGERIFAARFFADRGFLVTFRLIDPLFSFDLTDPHAPALRGELEIPGFSEYIHPLGDDHLLTIGRDGTDQGAGRNVQLQIFDVSSLDQPTLTHTFVPQFDGVEQGWSWSVASYDHKAFTYFEPHGILSIPISYSGSDRDSQFNGFLVLRVDPDAGFEELGRIDHDDLAYEAYCSDSGEPVPFYCSDPIYRLGANPLRTVIMSEADVAYIYSLSDVGIKATPATDANDVLGKLLLPAIAPAFWIAQP